MSYIGHILLFQGQQQIYEDESKQIRCLNAQMLRCCTYNQRTVLIVCSKYWQVVLWNQIFYLNRIFFI